MYSKTYLTRALISTLKEINNRCSNLMGLSDICAQRHLLERYLCKVGMRERERERESEREREREREMALLATYPDLT